MGVSSHAVTFVWGSVYISIHWFASEKRNLAVAVYHRMWMFFVLSGILSLATVMVFGGQYFYGSLIVKLLKMYFYLYYYLCTWVCAWTCHSTSTEVRKKPCKAVSLLSPLHRTQGLNSGCQGSWQVLLQAEPPHWPYFILTQCFLFSKRLVQNIFPLWGKTLKHPSVFYRSHFHL